MGDADAIKALSAAQKAAIKESWAAFSSDIQGHGSKVLVQFFKDFPSDQSYFDKFQGRSPDDLVGDPQLGVHATQVFGYLNTMLGSMDNPDKVVELLKKNAVDHIPRNVRLPQYKELFSTLVTYLQGLPGAKAEAKGAWEAALGAMGNIIDAEQKRNG